METRRWNERLMGSTRGRVITLLRRNEHTVNELADALGLTDNAVRMHLSGLERDGLVTLRGVRRGVGKPAHVYALTREADSLFPRAYGVVLRTLLDSLRRRLADEEVDALVAEVGARLGGVFARAGGDLSSRAEAAVAVLAELGGVAEARVEGGVARIRGFGCPLREAVDGHPEVCRIAAALLSEVVGYQVTECCDREGADAPSCRFTFAA
ncbi:MAG TPA: ArsR family transcriptional regulator [Longimicrobium sp.]|nr:ArsR family transcriptional regulator [Longimicrobium sp.]